MQVSGAQWFIVFTLFVSLSACGRSRSGDDAGLSPPQSAAATAATLHTREVLSAAEYLAEPRYANADTESGRRLAVTCRACHSFEAGGPHLTGPNLHGFFGRRAGSVESYAYSPAMAAADFVWTPAALDAWLAQPAAFLPGNWMIYAGLPDATDRNDLVAALLGLTGDSPAPPE